MTELFEKKEMCCGCGACMVACPYGAISMQADEEGFLYPQISEALCVNCGRCKSVCAFQSADAAENQALPQAYAIRHKDGGVLYNSSSGGAFTAISDWVLEQDGVVFGAVYDGELRVVHGCANTKEARNRMRGSKYVQSDMRDVFSQVKAYLQQGREVLFTGTPCQAASLRRYLRGVDCSRLLLCDLICHGTPSPKLFGDYFNMIEARTGDKLIAYQCRSKHEGWGLESACTLNEGKSDVSSFNSQLWTKMFLTFVALRPSCHICKYASISRPSDITIGDFWDIKKILPEFYDKRGVSMLLVNTERGRKVLERIRGNVTLAPVAVEDAVRVQHNLREPTSPSPNRDKFWQAYYAHGFEAAVRKYGGCGMKARAKHEVKRAARRLGVWTVMKAMKERLTR